MRRSRCCVRQGRTEDRAPRTVRLAPVARDMHHALGLQEGAMPEKATIDRARKDKREGKSRSTQAGAFVREEIHHVREGKHGVRSAKQAIAIGLAKARRAGVKLPTPKKGAATEETRERAQADSKAGRRATKKKPSRARSRASLRKLKGEGKSGASRQSLSRHARSVAKRRTSAQRSASARKAARTRARSS